MAEAEAEAKFGGATVTDDDDADVAAPPPPPPPPPPAPPPPTLPASPPDVKGEGCWMVLGEVNKSSRCSSRARRLAISLLSCLFRSDPLLSTRGREEESISGVDRRSGFRIKGGEDSEVVAASSSMSVNP